METDSPGINYALPVGHMYSVDAGHRTPPLVKYFKVTTGGGISGRSPCGDQCQVRFLSVIKKHDNLLFLAYERHPLSLFIYDALPLERE